MSDQEDGKLRDGEKQSQDREAAYKQWLDGQIAALKALREAQRLLASTPPLPDEYRLPNFDEPNS